MFHILLFTMFFDLYNRQRLPRVCYVMSFSFIYSMLGTVAYHCFLFAGKILLLSWQGAEQISGKQFKSQSGNTWAFPACVQQGKDAYFFQCICMAVIQKTDCVLVINTANRWCGDKRFVCVCVCLVLSSTKFNVRNITGKPDFVAGWKLSPAHAKPI